MLVVRGLPAAIRKERLTHELSLFLCSGGFLWSQSRGKFHPNSGVSLSSCLIYESNVLVLFALFSSGI